LPSRLLVHTPLYMILERRTRVTGIGIGIQFSLGELQVLLGNNLVECISSAGQGLASVAVTRNWLTDIFDLGFVFPWKQYSPENVSSALERDFPLGLTAVAFSVINSHYDCIWS
jgi:hypothetical protein